MDDGRFTYPVTMQDLGTDGGVMPWGTGQDGLRLP